MTISPASPLSSAHPSLSAEAGPSSLVSSPTNKRAASTSLSDSESFTKTSKIPPTTTPAVTIKSAAGDAYRRKRKKKKFVVTQNVPCISSSSSASGSGSLKGKGRAIEAEDSSNDLIDSLSETNASDKLALLQTKLGEQTTLLDAHKEFLFSLAPSLTCQICLDPMHRPYTLAPCGHTACYECLLAWFRAPPPHIGQPPPEHLAYNFDAEEPTLLARDAPMLLKKEKTCPHCRAVVRDTPVEAWGIKDIVSHLFAHKGGAAKDLYPSYTRPIVASEAGVGQIGADAWRGVFKRGRIPGMLAVRNGNGNDGGVRLNGEDGQRDGARGFYDDEDAVYRCTACYHEIWDGICSSCGRLYPGFRDDFGDVDEDIDPGRWMDAEEFHVFDEGEPVDPDQVFGEPDADIDLHGLMEVFARGVGLHRGTIHHEHDEEGEEGYESSFIDDDEHVRVEEYHSAEEAGEYGSEDEEVMGNDEDNEDHRPRRALPPRIVLAGDGENLDPRNAIIESNDSDSNGSDPQINYRRPQASRNRIDSDNDDADSDVQHAVNVPGVARGRRAIVIDSDSEGEEHEHSDVGDERTGRFYARSLSDEGSISGDDSDHSSQLGSLHGSVSGLSHDNYDNYVFSDEERDINWSD